MEERLQDIQGRLRRSEMSNENPPPKNERRNRRKV